MVNSAALEKFFATAQSYEDGPNSADYKDRRMRMEEIRIEVANLMAKNQLDALVYPHQKCLVLPIGATFQKDRNGVIAALGVSRPSKCPPAFPRRRQMLLSGCRWGWSFSAARGLSPS